MSGRQADRERKKKERKKSGSRKERSNTVNAVADWAQDGQRERESTQSEADVKKR